MFKSGFKKVAEDAPKDFMGMAKIKAKKLSDAAKKTVAATQPDTLNAINKAKSKASDMYSMAKNQVKANPRKYSQGASSIFGKIKKLF